MSPFAPLFLAPVVFYFSNRFLSVLLNWRCTDNRKGKEREVGQTRELCNFAKNSQLTCISPGTATGVSNFLNAADPPSFFCGEKGVAGLTLKFSLVPLIWPIHNFSGADRRMPDNLKKKNSGYCLGRKTM